MTSRAPRLDGRNAAAHHSHVHLNEVLAPRTAATCFKAGAVARLRKKQPVAAVVSEITELFALLGDPWRVRILWMLREVPEVCVCDVAHVLGVSVSTASHHLRRLRAADIVTTRSDGKWVHYSFAATPAADVARRTLEAAGR